jgi:hypothetical protein
MLLQNLEDVGGNEKRSRIWKGLFLSAVGGPPDGADGDVQVREAELVITQKKTG